MSEERRTIPPKVTLILAEPPEKQSRLTTISLRGITPGRGEEHRMLEERGVSVGYIHHIGEVRVISWYEEDKVIS